MSETYLRTRDLLEDYFDRTAAGTWERLTSDAPVSRIRRTVRAGRDRMRAALLSRLPRSLAGMRVLDAGCGTGQMAVALAERGAKVVAVDISPSLLEIARRRTPANLADSIQYLSGDMLNECHGRFHYVVAMDSLIHYEASDIARSLARLAARTEMAIGFTVAPRTPLLAAMHLVGKAFPRSDRSPAIVPIGSERLQREVAAAFERNHADPGWLLSPTGRVTSGFYISEAMELRL